ncbi:hypothetical protein [Enterovibrio baiacu]|uniref:hypothetical protein n=1 Tax=Enterovibrio baiacu TaxID=2491023 RepID=UPI003D12AB1E
MTEEERYKALDFIVSIAKPWDGLHAFLQLPYALDSKFSDPIIQARALAITVQHQTDYDKIERGNSLNDEALASLSPAAMRIRDLCNTIKHIKRLGKKPHAWVNGISAEVIVNDDNTFQFLRNKIEYEHEIEGIFDLMNDLYLASKFWANRRGVDLSHLVNWNQTEVSVTAKAPQDNIYLVSDPNVSIFQTSQNLRINTLVKGKLVKTSHPNVSIAILDRTKTDDEIIQGLFQ